MRSLNEDAKLTRVSNAVAAGQTTVNCTHVDMQGFRSVAFVVLLGAITASGTPAAKIQVGDLADDSDMADVTSSSASATASDDNKVLRVELLETRHRYARVVITRGGGADTVIDGALAIQHSASVVPVTDGSTVVDSATVIDT